MIPRPQLPGLVFFALVAFALVLTIAATWRYILFALIALALGSSIRTLGRKWHDDERGSK